VPKTGCEIVKNINDFFSDEENEIEEEEDYINEVSPNLKKPDAYKDTFGDLFVLRSFKTAEWKAVVKVLVEDQYVRSALCENKADSFIEWNRILKKAIVS